MSETSQSSDTIPTLELDAEVNEEIYDTIEESSHHQQHLADTDFYDDDTPTGMERRAVSPPTR